MKLEPKVIFWVTKWNIPYFHVFFFFLFLIRNRVGAGTVGLKFLGNWGEGLQFELEQPNISGRAMEVANYISKVLVVT